MPAPARERYLAGIQVPTLILRAADDPLISSADIPHDLLQLNGALLGVITPQGGHVGWIEGPAAGLALLGATPGSRLFGPLPACEA
jgi:predicted alpha/beta-fold hydrolase